MRIASFVALALSAMVAACSSMSSSGEPATVIAEPAIAAAYIPLSGNQYAILEGHGAAVVIRPGIAVTNAHNRDFLPGSATVIGESTKDDLLFFRVQNESEPPTGEPTPGERVIAYGQGSDADLRRAEGTIRWRVAPVRPRCPACPDQKPFAYEADAGPGFSGGPVIDATSGKLLGITFGYNDESKGGAEKLMYAYDMNEVNSELSRLLKTAPSGASKPH